MRIIPVNFNKEHKAMLLQVVLRPLYGYISSLYWKPSIVIFSPTNKRAAAAAYIAGWYAYRNQECIDIHEPGWHYDIQLDACVED